MRFGAIDIGSNAMRLLIAEAREEDNHATLKKLTLIRVPVRLGETVFTTGLVTPLKIKKLSKSISAFRLLMEVYGVEQYRICATSAMREARNQAEVVEKVKALTGETIQVIDGDEEADLIHSTFETLVFDLNKDYLYIDVGGGSTELSLLRQGKAIHSRSFRIGTVRSLKKKVDDADWQEMLAFAGELGKQSQGIQAIGTGGNINKLVKLSPVNNLSGLQFAELSGIMGQLEKVGLKERMRQFDLKADRADVIIPAGHIYMDVMKAAGIDEILVPKLGLSDGIIYDLYKKHRQK
ncbi:MAG: hypothetical protein V4616_09160 [Bacteroidota bacterium]